MQKLPALFLLTVFMAGCVDSDPIKIIDTTSGIYYLSGSRVTVEDPCVHCPAGQDTLRESVSFSVIIQIDPDNQRRVQFYGIQGADTGDFDKRVFPGCTRSADCEVIGAIQTGGAFEIDIENNGHRYRATGTINRSVYDDEGRYRIVLQGQYSYNDITIDYDLEGKKVSLTLD